MTALTSALWTRGTGRWLAFLGLAVVAVAFLYPLIWLLSASVRSPAGVFSDGLAVLPSSWHWNNYTRAWDTAHLGRGLLNSLIVTAGAVGLIVVRSALAGYVIGRFSFTGRRVVVAALVATLFVPAGASIIPLVDLSLHLGILNSLAGPTLALGGAGQVAAILLYAGYFAQIPAELEEAAMLEGAGFLRIFALIMVPLAKPVTVTVTLLSFLFAWNSFFVPLVFTYGHQNLRTVAVGMVAFTGTQETDWAGLCAAAIISLFPLIALFLAMQKHFVEGIAGAIK